MAKCKVCDFNPCICKKLNILVEFTKKLNNERKENKGKGQEIPKPKDPNRRG